MLAGIAIRQVDLARKASRRALQAAQATRIAALAAQTQSQTSKAAYQMTRDNAQIQLRAYLAPGGADEKQIEFTTDPGSKKENIVIHFHNAGQTPARHFETVSLADIGKGSEPTFRTRYIEEMTNGAMKGVGNTVTRGLSLEDATIGAGSSYLVSFPTDATNAVKFLQRSRGQKAPAGPFIIAGLLEYCDVFGVYWCDSFSYELVPGPYPRFRSSSTSLHCNVPAEVVPPTGTPKGDPVKFTALPRCEQPDELKQNQGGTQAKR